MTAPTLNSVDLSNCDNIAFTLSSNIVQLPFPGSGSSSADVFDLTGVTRVITVNGVFTGATTAAVKTKVDNIAALIDGDQTATVEFVTDELGTVNVMVASFDVTWEVPSNRARYSLKLLEGTSS